MNTVDAIFSIGCSIVGLWIIGMFVAEWIGDSKLKRDMRDAGIDDAEIKAMFRAREMGRSRHALPGSWLSFR
jgi:hypothetical protein